jgi:hypothetical protein
VVEPLVDVVIPVHAESRPVERAVGSVLSASNAGRIRVTVVAHEIEPRALEKRLPASVRVLPFEDGVQSAAGPVNAGIEAATAEYLCRVDSDDYLEDGALDAWMAHVAAHRPEVLLGRLSFEGRGPVPVPLTRPFRLTRLDPIRDRLAYRTNPLGLIHRETVRRRDLRFTPGLRVGEDLEIGLDLWFRSRRIDFAGRSPSYVVGGGAKDRSTLAAMPAEIELAATSRLIELDWVSALSVEARRAIAIKLTRVHVLGRLTRDDVVPDEDQPYVSELLARLDRFAPGFRAPFARADRELLDAASDPEKMLREAANTWRQSTRASRMLTPSWIRNVDRESTVRRYVGYRTSPARATRVRWR